MDIRACATLPLLKHPPAGTLVRTSRGLPCTVRFRKSERSPSAVMLAADSLNQRRRAALLVVVLVACVTTTVHAVLDPSETLDCHKRLYSYKVTQADSQGRICWDTINVMSCWGRCDSNEISDWRFPYKRSFHPVCLHGARETRTVTLKHCEEGAEPGTEQHQYLHAISCKCHICKSSEASCQGLRYTPREIISDGQSDIFTESGGTAWNELLEPLVA